MLPMPMPAPSAPRPTPRARPIAFPAFVTSPDVAARRVFTSFLLVIRCAGKAGTAPLVGDASMLRLDCRADVDGGQSGEDERLNPDDDDNLEDVEQRRRHENEQENPG